MSKLQTKCMFGSAVVHTLLLVALVVGSAFVSKKPDPVQVPLFNMFNVQVTDFETQGGGGGGVPQPVNVPKPTPPTPAPQPEVQPIKQPVPAPVKIEPKPEPVKVEPKKVDPPKPKDTPKPKPIAKVPDKKVEKIPENKSQDAVKLPEPPKKHTVTPELSKVIKPDVEAEQKKAQQRRDREEARKRAEAEAREQREAQVRAFERAVTDANAKAQAMAADRAAAFDRAANRLANEGAGASPISIPGPGAAAFVNYSQLVWSMYYQAWQAPQERANNQTARVEIIVARDGTVKSAMITSKSGDPTVDKSVQQALDRVKRLPAFPVGATDETRTFNLNFNLKPKRQLF